MSQLLWCQLILRWKGGSVAPLAALHAALVAWVAWYLAEAAWVSAPISAPLTPLPPITFLGSWAAGTIFLLAAGPAVGAGAMVGSWVGPDPTFALPPGRAARVAVAWVASGAILTIVSLAPLPIYLVLYEMGAFGPSEIARPVLAQACAIAVAPLVGMAIRRARQGRPAASW